MMQTKLGYRPEIDGLRCFAVISVILYHAEIQNLRLFEAGFLGVDIFFVISGYLITRILLTELMEQNKLSLVSFYERRARRILPALLFVIIVSLPFAYQLLIPSALIDMCKSILSTILFSSNFYFYFESTVYGDNSALLKPFLHTWSLGVEEQFYLGFPIFGARILTFTLSIS